MPEVLSMSLDLHKETGLGCLGIEIRPKDEAAIRFYIELIEQCASSRPYLTGWNFFAKEYRVLGKRGAEPVLLENSDAVRAVLASNIAEEVILLWGAEADIREVMCDVETKSSKWWSFQPLGKEPFWEAGLPRLDLIMYYSWSHDSLAFYGPTKTIFSFSRVVHDHFSQMLSDSA